MKEGICRSPEDFTFVTVKHHGNFKRYPTPASVRLRTGGQVFRAGAVLPMRVRRRAPWCYRSQHTLHGWSGCTPTCRRNRRGLKALRRKNRSHLKRVSALSVSDGWALLPPGDPGLTRRVKAAGEHWVVQDKRGRKIFSGGVWAPVATIEQIRSELVAERGTEKFARKREAAPRRRETVLAEYVEDFHTAFVTFLAFHPAYTELAHRLARAVTDHATPVGSGTVARTQRIPVEERAEAAMIAWMRHQTTAYDSMHIPRVKGHRREVRRMLARRSKELLDRYRRGGTIADTCPLHLALMKVPSE